jgi:uncharacterized protein DUF6438
MRRALLLATLAAACARPSPGVPANDSVPAPQVSATPSVSLERQPCFGTCPVYTVTIDRSGAVRFEGRRFVADTGVSISAIPPARVDSLLAELEAAGYFGFADRYAPGEPVCEHPATDLPTAITEVHLRDRTKRIEHYYGCSGAPAILDSLERRIDSVAGVGRWVGGGER